MGRIDDALEGTFEKIGRAVGTRPWLTIGISILVAVACGGGWAMIENESRPEKQWVARGALALEHNDYVQATWPGNARFNLFAATCADVDEGSCNILDPKYIQRLHEINAKIMELTVDGDWLVDEINKELGKSPSDSHVWNKLAGKWSFMGTPKEVDGSVVFEGRTCFSFGPFCGKASILDVFRDDPNVIKNLDESGVKRAVNFWEEQEIMCPLTIASEDSPCYLDNCQKYDSRAERTDCRVKATDYCSSVCPTRTFMDNGRERTVPEDMATCMDRGCIQLGSMDSGNGTDMLNTDPNSSTTGDGGDAPESAFEFQPTKLNTMVGALSVDDAGLYTRGKYLAGYYALNKHEIFIPSLGNVDPLADEWERRALCYMGYNVDESAKPKLDCPKDSLLDFSVFFGRSFGDEFGAAIQGDIVKLSASYLIIIIYCGFMLGKRDIVHSGIGLSITALVIIGLVIVGSFGLMGYIGVPNSNLNNNLYFLILGLGVDDAFVLTSEFVKHTTESPGLSIPERIAKTAKTGGISVLVTSATDALAFLVGSTTVLPALSWFCAYAGTAIVLCYIFQLTVFLPALALNAKRAEASRPDVFCCCKASERAISDPKGCCFAQRCAFCLRLPTIPDGALRRGMKASAEKMTTLPGQLTTIVVFIALAVVGIVGSTKVYKDFKLEWFIPDDSPVNTYFDINSKYFATGTKISINMRAEPDAFEAQPNLRELHEYLSTSELVNGDVGIDSWYEEFMEWAANPDEMVTASATFSPSRADADAVFDDRSAFYTALHSWYRSAPGGRFRGSLRWNDADCEVDSTVEALPSGCDVTEGLKASRFNVELTLASTDKGTNRYTTMESMRADVARIHPNAFPYSFDFLYWEEVGVIDVELVRNLLICGAVILVIVALLVPDPRVSVWVIVCVGLSIVDTLGFMYYWDVTISGVSTIYVLICVGLSVDYAAHIAHMFKDSRGTARERAIAAVERIGPCTFNAVMSTFLAVVVISFSNSYVFRIFFKVLFLVVIIAGGHGLWLLPVLLSLVGGSREAYAAEAKPAEGTEVNTNAEGA